MIGLRVTIQAKKQEWWILYSFLSSAVAAKVCFEDLSNCPA